MPSLIVTSPQIFLWVFGNGEIRTHDPKRQFGSPVFVGSANYPGENGGVNPFHLSFHLPNDAGPGSSEALKHEGNQIAIPIPLPASQ
jgi:hypothetical protein